MIQVVDVEKRFGHQLLFQGLSWHIRRSERIGLVGPNGAGKTTLLRIIAGDSEVDAGQIVRSRGVRVGLLDQEQDFRGQHSVLEEVLRASPERQEVEAELRALEAGLETADPEQLAHYATLQDRFEILGGYTAENEARRLLSGLGFTEAEMTDSAERFSGGWRMRIALARLLLARPDVLLLDEPTNHLDLESIVWLEDHLAAYEGAVVTVSHDRYHLNRTCEHIAALSPLGVQVYRGGYDRFVEQQAAERSLLEKRYAQQQREIAQQERFIERFRAKNTKATAVQSRVKALNKLARIELAPTARSMRGFQFPQPGRSGRNVVELSAVSKAYGDNQVYRDLDLTIERGWKVALVGVNGAGKSTLLKILAGELEINSGERRLGHNVTTGYFGQHQLESLRDEWTVLQEMEAVADVQTYPMVRGILGAFLFSGEAVKKPVGVLSGGEKVRVALSKLLLHPVTLLLMDEPTSHLDLESRGSLEDALVRYEGTAIVISHDRYFVDAICTHVLEIDQGSASWYPGNYSAYLWKKAQQKEAGEADESVVRTSAGRKAVSTDGERKVDDQRSRKRAEAERRNRVYKATQDLRKESEQVEAAIEIAEARLQVIDSALADPAVYQAGGEAPTLLTERATLEQTLSTHYSRWEELEAEIEEATASAEEC